MDEWITGPRLPGERGAALASASRADAGRGEAFAKDGSLSGVKKDWVTAEWLDFLGALPQDDDAPHRWIALDQAFAFSKSGNAEVLSAWLLHMVRSDY